MPKHIDIFIAYAREDEELLTELKTHLTVLERTQNVKIWYDGLVEAGQEWQATTKKAMQEAEIILLLISADFIASDECYNESMTTALAMHKADKCRVIPVILRHCLWKETPFAALQALPSNGEPIQSSFWKNSEEPFLQVTQKLSTLVYQLQDIPTKENTTKPIADAATELPSIGNRRLPRYWFFIGGALLTIAAGIIAYYFFEEKEKEKERIEKVEKRLADSTEAMRDFNRYIEEADIELLGNPHTDDYIKAVFKYRKALDVVHDFNVNTFGVKEKIKFCESKFATTQKIDSTYLKALQNFQEKLNLGHKLYREGADLRQKGKKDDAINAFHDAKKAYEAAIVAAGKNAIDVSPAHEGRYVCEQAILDMTQPVAVITQVPPSRTTDRRQQSKPIKVKPIKVTTPVPIKIKNWEESMAKSAKMIEIDEKYKKVEALEPKR